MARVGLKDDWKVEGEGHVDVAHCVKEGVGKGGCWESLGYHRCQRKYHTQV